MQSLALQRLPRSAVLLSLFAALVVAAFVPAFAVGSGASAGTSVSAGNPTVTISGSRKDPLKFETPKTVVSGEDLTIVNKTNPKQIGPHTLSLVPKSLWPETKAERKPCFTPGHICMSIAKWHGIKGEDSPVTINPVKVGKSGWDTEGTVSKKGDSWFAGKVNAEFTQKVSATPGTTLEFICAVHPWMHGSIEVVAGD